MLEGLGLRISEEVRIASLVRVVFEQIGDSKIYAGAGLHEGYRRSRSQ